MIIKQPDYFIDDERKSIIQKRPYNYKRLPNRQSSNAIISSYPIIEGNPSIYNKSNKYSIRECSDICNGDPKCKAFVYSNKDETNKENLGKCILLNSSF